MKRRNKIYNLYWYFAYERQNIFYEKINDKQAPWTDDEILREYKFCNVYRVNDRVSQYLLKNVIYGGKGYTNEDMIFRIILFKLFNKESTWELLENNIGDIKIETFNFEKYSNVLEGAISNGVKIYNDAYISCANKAYGFDRKHNNHLGLIKQMFIEDKAHLKILNAENMEEAFTIIKSYPLIGDFMAYQLITDINYSNSVNFDEMSFTIIGPGSERGINKCFSDLEGMKKQDVIKWMCDHQDEEFKRLGFDFKKLGNRQLQYIDCQGLFCEVDKYCRQAVPSLKSNRQKIKKKYVSKKEKIEFVYPPKWNIDINNQM